MSVVAHQENFRGTLSPGISRLSSRKILLGCGIAFPLLWVGMDIVASMLYEGYSYQDQTVSELSAIDAPTRPFWFACGTLWSLLVIAFAVGVWQSAGRTRALRIVAGLLIAYAVITLTVGPFSSMHQREVLAARGATLSDTLHLIVTGIGVFTFLLEIGFAATAFGTWFRLYSIATIVAMLVFGAITSVYAPQVQANEPTPWVGVYERINAYGYMLWIGVLAATLWRNHDVGRVLLDAPGYFSGNNDRQLTSASDRGLADSSTRNRCPSDDGMKS
jgi:hypothetical protein